MFERLKERRLRQLISRLCDPNQKVAEKAEGRLFRYGASALEPLLQLVNHESPHVRYRVAWILGKTKDPRAFEAILKLTEDSDYRVAYDALMALGELKDERAVPHLFRLFNANLDHPEDLDGAAVMALAKLGVVEADDPYDP